MGSVVLASRAKEHATCRERVGTHEPAPPITASTSLPERQQIQPLASRDVPLQRSSSAEACPPTFPYFRGTEPFGGVTNGLGRGRLPRIVGRNRTISRPHARRRACTARAPCRRTPTCVRW